jgi:hypothetical protein
MGHDAVARDDGHRARIVTTPGAATGQLMRSVNGNRTSPHVKPTRNAKMKSCLHGTARNISIERRTSETIARS